MTAKGEFLKKFNEAFVNGDEEFVLTHVTDDIRWNVVGEALIQGKSEFKQTWKSMPQQKKQELTITKIITHGITAAVEGKVFVTDNMSENRTYAFCDLYRFNQFKDGIIKEIDSYVIEIKE